MLKLHLIKNPITTEKSVAISADNKYVFKVARDANKIEIAKAIKELYGSLPVKVNISNLPGKISGRGRTKRRPFKKAIVTFAPGTKIDTSKIK